MVYIIGIIVAIIIISIIKEFIVDHWKGLLLLLGVILAFVFTGPPGGITLLLIIGFIYFVREQIKRSNEKKLINYLNKNCTNLGLVSSSDFGRMAPGFSNKKYKTSFFSIMNNFVSQNEDKYITNNVSLAEPAVNYIHSHVMADMQELMKLSYPEFAFTHFTANEAILERFLGQKCGTANSEFSNIKLQEEKVKQELASQKIPYSAAYLNAYKLNSEGLLTSDSFESEEVSLDDL